MKTITTQIAIIAAGPAGLCAAVAAAEEGMQVAVFEKASVAGGTANMGMGPFGVESRLQKREMIGLTKEEAFRRFMDYVHWQSNAQLVHDYFWKSGSTIDWLEDMGVVFAGAMKNFPDSEATWHVVMPEGGGTPGARSAGAMNKVIYNNALELGVDFYFDTPAYEIIKDGERACGLRARSNAGEEYEVMADAVIIATGGFGTNPEMVKEFTGYTLGEDMFDFMIPGIVGDGLKMAWAAGAGKSRMEMEMVVGQSIREAATGQYGQCRAFTQACPVAINILGNRICDESVMQNATIAANIVDFQPGKVVYRILSDSILKHYKKYGIDYPSKVFTDDPTENFVEEWTRICELFPDKAFMADTPEELAEKIGMPVETFVDTIERYNDMCEQNLDDDFGKHHRYLVKLKGKYYAYKQVCSAYGTLGGIKINHRLEVLTEDNKVIPGLYGAGSDVCDIYNGTYYYYFPGNTMGFAVNTGRMAGEYAAEYVSDLEDA